MPQTIETGLFAGSPLPVMVNGVPATASSGFVVRVVMVAAGIAAGASGPGSAATPESAGMASGVGTAAASAGRSRAPASAATTATSFV